MPAEKFVILKNFSIGAILYFDEMLPSWVFMWARKLQAKAKRLLHNSQACGLSPVSISRPSINFPNVDDQHHNIEKGTTWETKQKPKKKSNKIFFSFNLNKLLFIIVIYNYTQLGFLSSIHSAQQTRRNRCINIYGHRQIWKTRDPIKCCFQIWRSTPFTEIQCNSLCWAHFAQMFCDLFIQSRDWVSIERVRNDELRIYKKKKSIFIYIVLVLDCRWRQSPGRHINLIKTSE